MRISGNSLTESVYQLYGKFQTDTQVTTTFDDLLRSAADDVRNATEPHLQIMADYRAWKSQQPERVLPDSKGATEENLAYLLENFTGELSLFQRIEVVDTMREMGILTHNEMMNALGMGEFCLVAEDIGAPVIYCTGLAGDNQMQAWSTAFHQLPLSRMNNLDLLFEILDIQLRVNKAEDTAAEIREVLERVRPEVNE